MKKINKVLLTAALTLVTGLSFAEKTLKIGIEGAYPPFSQVNAKGEVVGFDIDIAKALCVEMKRNCEFIQLEWDGLIPALKGRKIDAIIASMSATEERKKSIDFTDRYYRIPARAVRKKGMDIAFDAKGLKGKTIGLAGRLDVAVASALVIQRGFLDKDGKEFEFFGPLLTDEKYYGEGTAVGIRKNQEKLKSAFNAAIKAIRSNGVYKKINDQYFDFDVYGGE
ncbi:MAG: hypothetical protein CR976_00570 [Thiotrichales bacterium]|nr:MAG: hypothetical protein CR976_00570 [Thiotrichales bacterium]